MCGICGIAYSRRSGRRAEERTVRRMRDQLVHRGPDEAGTFVEGVVGLGHRRLSIIDLASGQQPMSSADGRFHIVYNGEVFNHDDLRRRLEAGGALFRTRCDTEAVLRLFAQAGDATPTHLRGMFAFAVWDSMRQELVLARDRFGIKPLYYALGPDGTLYFASEIKALLASGAVRPSLNMRALPDYLANHATSGDETLFAGVRRLAPGHTLRWRDGELVIRPYWDLSFASPRDSGASDDARLVDEYAERLREAVRLRLMSDVPLGVFLSGGIDSAAITAITSDLLGGGVKTFSVAFREREANELAYARIVAERFSTDHHEVVIGATEFFEALPRLLWHEDEPLAHPSSVALHFVSKLAASHVKVVLTGEGSDETLAGYGRYLRTVHNVRLGHVYDRFAPEAARALVARAVRGLAGRSRQARRLTRTFLCEPATIDALYLDGFAVFSRLRQASLLTDDAMDAAGRADPYAVARRLLDECDARSTLDRLLYLDTKTYLHELLMKQDQMSMSASIESRVPFLDHPLVEFAASLPARMKLRGGTTKYVLRRAMRHRLPAAILERPKMGFPVPIGAWLRGTHRSIVDEYVLGDRALARGLFRPDYLRRLVAEDRAGRGEHWERLWSLVTLEMWQRLFLDGDAIDGVETPRAHVALAAR